VGAAVVVLIAAGAAPAEASTGRGVLQCVGTETISFDPPLTDTPRPTRVSFTENFDRCLLGGVSAGSGSGESSETTGGTAVSVPTATATYHWNTGRCSTVTWSANVVTKLNGTIVVTAYGTVADGLFRWATVQSEVVLPQPDLLAAMGKGVSSVSGPDTLTFAK
jgi:hypothetical protein